MKITQKSIETLMVLSAEMISNAKVGDTAVALSSAPILFPLFKDHYNYFGGESHINRDRFVLADNSVSAVYYALMNMFGFNIAGIDLLNYSKFNGKTPYNPCYAQTEGVDICSGDSGAAISMAVGLAIANNSLSKKFNVQKFDVIDNHIFCFTGEEGLMKGSSMEAISLAGTLKLKNLVLIYNHIPTTIDGKLNDTNQDNIKKKFKAMGWNVITVFNPQYIWITNYAYLKAKRSDKPTIIIFKSKPALGTTYEGSNHLQSHFLTQFEIEKMKADFHLNGSFNIPNDVKQFCMRTSRKLKVEYQKWERLAVLYKNTHPELAEQLNAFYDKPKISFQKALKSKIEDADNLLDANNIILNALAEARPSLMGGSTNKAVITKAQINNNSFTRDNKRGRDIAFGDREFSAGNICNGICSFFGSAGFVSSTLSNANNFLPAIRHSSLLKLPMQYIFTHDSIANSKMAPIYTSVEQLSQLRLVPNFTIYRPADNTELLACQSLAYSLDKPNALILSEQKLEPLTNSNYEAVKKGAYVLEETENANLIIFASGIDIHLALEVKKLLDKTDIKTNIVSVPSIEIFKNQADKYKLSVLHGEIKKRVAIESSNDNSWLEFIGGNGIKIGLDNFVPYGDSVDVANAIGFNAKEIAKQLKLYLKY